MKSLNHTLRSFTALGPSSRELVPTVGVRLFPTFQEFIAFVVALAWLCTTSSLFAVETPRGRLNREQAKSYHLSTGIQVASRIRSTSSDDSDSKDALALTLFPNERIRIPIDLQGSIPAWKICLEVDGWWQVVQVEVFEDSSKQIAEGSRKEPKESRSISIADREWRPRLDELINVLHGGQSEVPSAARHFAREILFISNQPVVYVELTNRSQSQAVNITKLYAQPILVRPPAEAKSKLGSADTQDLVSQALITEYLSTDDSLRLLAASRRLQKNSNDAAHQIQSAMQSWLQYAKDRGVNCISVPVVFRRGSLYASDHVFKRPVGNVPHSPDTLMTDEQLVERFPTIDLVEQLYQACHITGLMFCPVIDLSFPVSQLDALSSKVVESPYRLPKGPNNVTPWNPQSRIVHEALTGLLQELPKRYGSQPGYCGFAVTVDPNSAWWMELDAEAMQPELLTEATQSIRRFTSADNKELQDAPKSITAKEFQNWQTDRIFKTLSLATPDLVRIYGPATVHSANFVSRWQFLNIENSPGSTPRNMLTDWWSRGIHSKCYSLESDGNRERYYQNKYCVLPNGDLLRGLKPIARSRELPTPDKLRLWASEVSALGSSVIGASQGMCMNANPWSVELQVQWSEHPGLVEFGGNGYSIDCDLKTESSNRFLLTQSLPPCSLFRMSWSNKNAQIVGWNNAKDHTMEYVQSLLAAFESALTPLSVPQSEGGLLFNGAFEHPPEEGSLQISRGWAVSLNSQAPFIRSRRPNDSENDCLQIVTQHLQSAWLQSDAFETDRSRLQVSAWLAMGSPPTTRTAPRIRSGLFNSAESSSSIQSLSVSVLLWNATTERYENVLTQQLSPSRQMDKEWQQWTADLSGQMASIVKEGQKHRIKLHWQLACEGMIMLDNLNATSDFLLEPERVELRNRLFVAKQLLKESNIDASLKLLEHSWPRLLRTSPGK